MPTSAAVRATCSRGGVGYMGRERLEGGGLGRLGIGGRQVEGRRAGGGGGLYRWCWQPLCGEGRWQLNRSTRRKVCASPHGASCPHECFNWGRLWEALIASQQTQILIYTITVLSGGPSDAPTVLRGCAPQDCVCILGTLLKGKFSSRPFGFFTVTFKL